MSAGHIFYSYKMNMSLARRKGKKDLFLIEYQWEDSLAKFTKFGKFTKFTKPLNHQYLYMLVKQQDRQLLIFHYEIERKPFQSRAGWTLRALVT